LLSGALFANRQKEKKQVNNCGYVAAFSQALQPAFVVPLAILRPKNSLAYRLQRLSLSVSPPCVVDWQCSLVVTLFDASTKLVNTEPG